MSLKGLFLFTGPKYTEHVDEHEHEPQSKTEASEQDH